MNEALRTYTAKVNENTWNQKTEDQKQILALTSRLNQTELKLKKSLEQKKSGSGGGRNSSGSGGANNNASQSGGGGSNTTCQKDPKQAWKDVPPKSGENPLKKTVGNKDFRWCKFHNHGSGKWARHPANKCKLNPKNKDNNDNASAPTEDTPSPKVPANLALQESLRNQC